MTAGVASVMAKTHINSAVNIVNALSPSVIPAARLLKGFTIAQYRSALNAVRVNTDTPIDTSLAHSEI